ncbi:DNA-binding barrel domain superfamily [Sesbania bispinosa]|nr:DNA-binding barrel domain superfamily [Sesbania bispinosa]
MAYTDCSNVCTHLTLESGSSSKKRKHDDKVHIGSRKKACNNEVGRSWGYSTELMFYDDPWKIKKILRENDLGNLSTLLLGRDLAQELVLPVLGVDVDLDNGTQVMISDMDTNSIHTLLFKRWVSSRSYVFVGS